MFECGSTYHFVWVKVARGSAPCFEQHFLSNSVQHTTAYLIHVHILQSDSSSQIREWPRPTWQETPHPLSDMCERVYTVLHTHAHTHTHTYTHIHIHTCMHTHTYTHTHIHTHTHTHACTHTPCTHTRTHTRTYTHTHTHTTHTHTYYTHMHAHTHTHTHTHHAHSFHYLSPVLPPVVSPPRCLQPRIIWQEWELYIWWCNSSQYSQSAQSWLYCSVLSQLSDSKCRLFTQYNLQYGHLHCWYFRMYRSSLWTMPVLSWNLFKLYNFKSNHRSKFHSLFSLFWSPKFRDMPATGH